MLKQLPSPVDAHISDQDSNEATLFGIYAIVCEKELYVAKRDDGKQQEHDRFISISPENRITKCKEK